MASGAVGAVCDDEAATAVICGAGSSFMVAQAANAAVAVRPAMTLNKATNVGRMISPPCAHTILRNVGRNGAERARTGKARSLAHLFEPDRRRLEIAFPDFVHDMGVRGERARLQLGSPRGADLLHRALRTPIGFADPEQHRIDECERMVQHQSLDLEIVAAAPIGACEKGPADLDFMPSS